MPDPSRSVTPRGFINFDHFTDSYGATVTVRESSAALAPHVWVFVEGGTTAAEPGTPGIPEGRKNDGSAHLNVEQATRLRDALDAFIRERGADPEFPATWAGGHALVVEFGDEELIARCQCGVLLGERAPSTPLDEFGQRWERHVMERSDG